MVDTFVDRNTIEPQPPIDSINSVIHQPLELGVEILLRRPQRIITLRSQKTMFILHEDGFKIGQANDPKYFNENSSVSSKSNNWLAAMQED